MKGKEMSENMITLLFIFCGILCIINGIFTHKYQIKKGDKITGIITIIGGIAIIIAHLSKFLIGD